MPSSCAQVRYSSGQLFLVIFDLLPQEGSAFEFIPHRARTRWEDGAVWGPATLRIQLRWPLLDTPFFEFVRGHRRDKIEDKVYPGTEYTAIRVPILLLSVLLTLLLLLHEWRRR